MNMNSAILGQGVLLLKRSILINMAKGERLSRRTCPVCEKDKNIDELACDNCYGKYGDELNDVIHNALHEINPEKYPNKKKTSLDFKTVDILPSKEIKIIKETESQGVVADLTVSSEINDPAEDNFIEVVPGFFLYRDEIEKMAKEENFFNATQCPICKNFKGDNSWVCPRCVEKHFLFKKSLIQYAIVRLPAHLNSVDGFICTQEDEEKLLDIGIKFLKFTSDIFTLKEKIKNLKVLLRYSPELAVWKLPLASCIVHKVIFHALAIINNRLLFKGAPGNTQGEDVVQEFKKSQDNLLSTNLQVAKQKVAVVGVEKEEIKKTKEDFLKEAEIIFSALRDNLNENPKAGKSLAVFLLGKFLEWRSSTGKKNPDSELFFSKAPFSRKFLEQLQQTGNCSLKFFSELKEFFNMSEEEILAEGLFMLNASDKENLSGESVQEICESNPSGEESQKIRTDKHKQFEDCKKDLYQKMAESLLEKIVSNLREAPLVAKALWIFIKEAAVKEGMGIIAFGETINIFSASLSALKVGGNKQQCLSVSKFREVVANLKSTEKEVIAKGLKILIEGGDKEAQEEFEKNALLN